MFKKTKKRAFTMVELVIVIAVIAILAAVLIPTFAHLIKAANESADQQAVKNMNTALIAEENINGIPKSPEAAMKVIEAEGYNVENYVAQLDENTLYYDWTENRVLIWTVEDGAGSVTYPSEMAKAYSGAQGIAGSWYTLSNAYVTTPVSSGDGTSFVSAITSAAEGETKILQLQEDLTISDSSLSNSAGAYVTIDLNGHTLTTSSTASGYSAKGVTKVSGGSTLYVRNGTIDIDSNMQYTNYTFYSITAGSSMTLENVNVTSDTTVLFPSGDAAQVNVINSTITTTGAYCVSTNAGTDDNYNVMINIQDSTLVAAGSPVCINVPSSCKVTGSVIRSTSASPVFVARGGNVTIDDCELYNDFTDYLADAYVIWNARMDDWTNQGTSYSYGTAWGSGTGVAYALLCVGNDADSKSYQYATTCTVTNTKFHANAGLMALYVEGNSTKNYGATLNYSGCEFYYHGNVDPYTDRANGTAYANTTPTKYNPSLFDSSNTTNPLNYAVIYTSNTASYVTINGTVYRDGTK